MGSIISMIDDRIAEYGSYENYKAQLKLIPKTANNTYCLECGWKGLFTDTRIGKGEDQVCPECSSHKLEEL